MPHEAMTFAGPFAAGLLDPGCPAPGILAGRFGHGAGKRYDVYRNNVTMSLAATVESIYPAVRALVGEKTFRGLAIDFVRAEPPVSPLLFEYARDFPACLDRTAPPEFAGWIGDVARLERLWLDTWHAADAPPLDGAALAAIPPDRLGSARFVVHPATRVLRSSHAVVSLFRAGRGEGEQPADRAAPEDALVTRPHLDVEVRFLPPGAADFLTRLIDGESLADAALAAARTCPDFDLASTIAGMLQAGAFTAIA